MLASLMLAACGGGGGADAGGVAVVHSPLSRAPVKPAPPRVSPKLSALRKALQAQLDAAGPVTGAMVYDLNTGETLFTSRADVKRAPASVEKLYTTLAVLDRIGSAGRVHTRLMGVGHLEPGGIWHGNLYLRGGGDPTLSDSTFSNLWYGGQGTTAQQLVQQLMAQGIRGVSGLVIGDPTLFDSHPGGPSSGYAPDTADMGGQLSGLTYDHGATQAGLSPGAFAAKELVLTMHAAHISAQAATFTAHTPAGAHSLAMVASAPMSALLRLMDVPSDDFFAEMLTKLLGAHYGRGGTTAAGSAVITRTLTRYRIHPLLVDGSGLDRADRSSPHEVVDLLRAVWNTQAGRALDQALPLVGVNGTVRHIGVGSIAQGRCIAKTGTLDRVTNLAGYCHSLGHQELAFAVFLDGPENSAGIVLLSRMVADMVRY